MQNMMIITLHKVENILDLKERYKAYKYSLGVEIKLLGYSFYSYPTALTYEYHIPLSDPWESKGKQYLKILLILIKGYFESINIFIYYFIFAVVFI